MDVYAIVTEKIVNLLEQGIVPWRRPWKRNGIAAQPHNEKAVPGRQPASSVGDQIRLALLAHRRPGPKARRLHLERGAGRLRRVSTDRALTSRAPPVPWSRVSAYTDSRVAVISGVRASSRAVSSLMLAFAKSAVKANWRRNSGGSSNSF